MLPMPLGKCEPQTGDRRGPRRPGSFCPCYSRIRGFTTAGPQRITAEVRSEGLRQVCLWDLTPRFSPAAGEEVKVKGSRLSAQHFKAHGREL